MPQATRMNVSWREIEALPPDIADSYGSDDLQFGALPLPETPRARYGLDGGHFDLVLSHSSAFEVISQTVQRMCEMVK